MNKSPVDGTRCVAAHRAAPGSSDMGIQGSKIVSVDDDTTGSLNEREQAHPIKRVLDQGSREVVGWLYKWNTGHVAIMWKGERCENVIYE
jgi:hypothetical protein